MIKKVHNAHLLKYNPDWYPDEWKIWENQPNDKHTWAFYYYLKKEGGNVIVLKGDDEKLNIALKKQL